MTREEFNAQYEAESKKDERIAYLSFLAEKNPKVNLMTFVSFGQAVNMLKEVYEDFESRTCTTCKHCDEVKERLIHCSYFEQYMPIEIGKCDMWEGK